MGEFKKAFNAGLVMGGVIEWLLPVILPAIVGFFLYDQYPVIFWLVLAGCGVWFSVVVIQHFTAKETFENTAKNFGVEIDEILKKIDCGEGILALYYEIDEIVKKSNVYKSLPEPGANIVYDLIFKLITGDENKNCYAEQCTDIANLIVEQRKRINTLNEVTYDIYINDVKAYVYDYLDLLNDYREENKKRALNIFNIVFSSLSPLPPVNKDGQAITKINLFNYITDFPVFILRLTDELAHFVNMDNYGFYEIKKATQDRLGLFEISTEMTRNPEELHRALELNAIRNEKLTTSKIIDTFKTEFKKAVERELRAAGNDRVKMMNSLKNYLQDFLPLYELLNLEIPLTLPFETRFSHCWVLAKTGHGKTQLLQSLIYQDFLQATQTKQSVIIMDSQGDLLDLLTRLKIFDPLAEHSLADKLIIIDPRDVENPPSLNIFDLNLASSSKAEYIKAYNFATSLYQYIFSDLVGASLTSYQENVFKFCSKVMLLIPGANIRTFFDFMKNPGKYQNYIDQADEDTRQFFKEHYHSKIYSDTKEQLSARLWAIIRDGVLGNIFTAPKNKIDMFKAMNEGKIIFINTAKDFLQKEAKIFGKFFIGLILQSAFQRASLPEYQRTPVFVYIDEFQDYVDSNVYLSDFFEQMRKYKIGLTVAHQLTKQLDDVSTKLKHSVTTNTAIKFIGRVNKTDAKFLADEIKVMPETILDLKKEDKQFTEYLYYADGSTPGAVKITIPLGTINRMAKMSNKSYLSLIENNREKYCTGKTPDEPSGSAPPPQKDSTGKSQASKIKEDFPLGTPQKLI